MKKNFGSALSFNAGLRAASKAGKLDNNPKFKAAVDNAPTKAMKNDAPMMRIDPSAMKAMGKPMSPMNIRGGGHSKERKKFKEYAKRTYKESDVFEPTRFSAEEKRSGAGAASQFIGKEGKGKRKKLSVKNVNVVKKRKSKSVAGNLLNVKNKGRKKLTTTSGKDIRKKAVTKGAFRGKRTIKIDSQAKQDQRAKVEGLRTGVENRGVVKKGADFTFKGQDKKDQALGKRKRKATLITKGKKAGVIQEKVKRKSGIGYRKTGRTAFDPTVAEAEKERKAKSRKG
jgi:hypothetical protein